MSKKRREKTKAKQRRHNESVTKINTNDGNAAPLSSTKSSNGSSSANASNVVPFPNDNKQLEQAAPLWKAMYSEISNSVSET